MKKLVLTFWVLIMVVWPVSVEADDSQNIVFTGTYSFNNVGTDADSAWLFIRYDGTLVDSTKITPEDLQWDGYYQYIHACTNDSVWGWSGWWIYFDGLTVSLPELATIATARDSSYALEASVTALRDTAQYLVTSDGDTNSAQVGDKHVIIVAYDTVASTVLARATITIINADSSSQRWSVTTNDSGVANFALYVGTYLVIGAGTREMGELDTISVSDDMTDTLFFWSVVVTAAATSQVCTVYGILCKPDGSRLSGADVTFTLSSSVTDTSSNVGIVNYEVYEVSNDTGYVEKQLVKNGNIDVSSYYQVTIRHGDIMPLTYEIFIPADSTTFDFVLGGRQR